MTAVIDETVLDVDLDLDPVCDNDHCDEAAQWVVHWNTPPSGSFCCDPPQLIGSRCKDRLDVAMTGPRGGFMLCPQHGVVYVGLRHLVRSIEAL